MILLPMQSWGMDKHYYHAFTLMHSIKIVLAQLTKKFSMSEKLIYDKKCQFI